MKRLARTISIPALLVLLTAACSPAEKPGAAAAAKQGAASPEQIGPEMQKRYAAGDIEGTIHLFHPEDRGRIAVELTDMAKGAAQQESDNAKALSGQLTTLYGKHGIDASSRESVEKTAGKANTTAYVIDLVGLLSKSPETKAPIEVLFSGGFKDIEVKGDAATGQHANFGPVRFAKVSGRWYVRI